jgi:hypothetical protein
MQQQQHQFPQIHLLFAVRPLPVRVSQKSESQSPSAARAAAFSAESESTGARSLRKYITRG